MGAWRQQGVAAAWLLAAAAIVLPAASIGSDAAPPSLALTGFTDLSVFAHPVCTLALASERTKDRFVLAEGGVCTAPGEACPYHAKLIVDGETLLLRRVAEQKDGAEFADARYRLKVTYRAQACPEGADACDGTDVEAVLRLSRDGHARTYRVAGYCGE